MGAFMFTREIARLSRRWFHVERSGHPGSANGVVPEEVLARIVPGRTTRAEVIGWCGPPSEERTRFGAGEQRTLSIAASGDPAAANASRAPRHRPALGRGAPRGRDRVSSTAA